MTSESTLTRDPIISGLKDLLRRQKQVKVDVDAIDVSSRLDRLGFDSLAMLDFMYDVEDRYKIRMDVTDLVRLQTVEDLIQHLEGKLTG